MRYLLYSILAFSNLAWLFGCITLSYEPETLQNFLARYGIVTTFAFQSYTLYAVVFALLAQCMIAAIIYGMDLRGSILKSRYKQESRKNVELKRQQKQIEQELEEQNHELEHAIEVEKEAEVLHERTEGMQQLVEELRGRNDALQHENAALREEVRRLEKSVADDDDETGILTRLSSFFGGSSK